MLDPTPTAAPFYPPHVKPAAQPLRFPLNFAALLRNNLELIPEQAYHEPLVTAPGPPRMAFITGTELVKALLFDQPMEYPKGALQVAMLKPLFGNAVVSAEGRDWKWQRGAVTPLFRHEELLSYGPVMTAAAEATVAKWRAAAPGTVHAIDDDMMHVSFRVISKAMLAGVPDDVLDSIGKSHLEYYKGANWWMIYALLGLPHWLPRPHGKAMRSHEARLRRAVGELVQRQRREGTAGDDMLCRLLRLSDPQSGESMSDELVGHNMLAFLVGGNDTTAWALVWTLYLISQSAEWEARMLREIQEVVGPGPVTAAHAAQLVTVQQVLNESLRLFPTAPIIVRDVPQDLKLDGVTIPAGTIAIIPIYAIQRHSRYWDDPNRFDPDRFAPERRSKATRFHYMPFGVGPRICIGASFALLEATILLASFVRAAHFELAPGHDPEPVGRMFLLAKKGMPMRVTPRASAA